jgi:hypothetical protein
MPGVNYRIKIRRLCACGVMSSILTNFLGALACMSKNAFPSDKKGPAAGRIVRAEARPPEAWRVASARRKRASDGKMSFRGQSGHR